jgi:hypothetical protein
MRELWANLQSWANRLLLACAALLLVVLAACQPTTTVGARRSVGEAKSESQQTLTAEQIKQKGGLCEAERAVNDPDSDSPEWVIWQAYTLAQGPDTDGQFQQFLALFPKGKDPKQIKEFYWNHLRSNVGKYVTTPNKGDFVICRTMAKSDGTQYYIKPRSAEFSAPPMRVGEVDGSWKFTFFTPF